MHQFGQLLRLVWGHFIGFVQFRIGYADADASVRSTFKIGKKSHYIGWFNLFQATLMLMHQFAQLLRSV